MSRIALYPGSFDPPTNGHAEVVRAALSLCERLVVGIGVHPSKSPLLPVEDRLRLLREVAAPLAAASGAVVDVQTFDELVVDFAREIGASILIRGLRDGADVDYEMRMAGMNGALSPELTTVFIPAPPEVRHITATLVRQIAAMGGDIAPFVPPVVAARLRHLGGR